MKINLTKTRFVHHRDGWNVAIQQLEKFSSSSGVPCLDWADGVFKKREPVTTSWCGFLHNVISYPTEYPDKYCDKRIFPLSGLVEQEFFKESLPTCRGIFTLCQHTADFLQDRTSASVIKLLHPVKKIGLPFDWNFFRAQPKILMVGQWLRRYHSFFELKCPYPKYMPRLNGLEDDYAFIPRYTQSKNVTFLPFLGPDKYDLFLSQSAVYLDLYDAAACNTILECLIRGTPILVRKLPAVEEYLGADYPLYFSDSAEADKKVKDFSLLLESHKYLQAMDKTKFSPEQFKTEFENSSIYRSLPGTKLL